MRNSTLLGVVFVFLINLFGPLPMAQADEILLPKPGAMVNLSPSYTPVMMKGIKIHPENPLLFDFILDTGKSGLKTNSPAFKAESQKLIKYFLASLTVKEDDLWVNLSPYEKDRMIPQELGVTELGRDMLAQDYILKQLTASLIYPEKELGKKFWDDIYAKAHQMYGVTNVPVNTFNKVWIVADKAKVLERNNVAYVVGSHLRVMLEEDYVALQKQTAITQESLAGKDNKAHTFASQIVREVIIPEIEKEVNQGQHFAPLRQMFYSMILASWYKLALKDALLNQVYTNKGKTDGVLSDDPTDKEKIYQQYLQAYKKGVFNFIEEDVDSISKQPIPRKYFSGGLRVNIPDVLERETNVSLGDNTTPDGAMVVVETSMSKIQHQDTAMVSYGDNEDVKEFDRIAGNLFARLQREIGPQLDKKRFLEIMSSSFGITEPDDEPAEGFYYARHKKALEVVEVLMAMPEHERERIIATIKQEQDYVSWMASGNHRYMGLVLAIVNLMNGRNIFDSTTINQLIKQDEEYRYLSENLLQYGNPYKVESDWVPSFMPNLNLSVFTEGERRRYQWLDIGSTIASHGSPALNFINRTMRGLGPSAGVDLHGIDVFASPYIFENGSIKPSEVYAKLKEGGGTAQYHGIRYYDARKAKYNLADPQFQLEQKFDFISMIMTLHHLTQAEEIPETLLLARDVTWIDDNGSKINPEYDLTKTQRESIEKLLSNLNTKNGILFLHLKEGVVRSGKMYSGNKRNDGQLIIIQRKGESTYQLFSPTIAFRPEKDPYSSIGFLMNPHPAPLYKTSGIRSIYAGQSESFFAGVERWLTRADLLVFRHQSRNASVWGALQLAAEAVRVVEKRPGVSVEEGLGMIFSEYLRQVPDSEPLKARLLDGVREWSRSEDLIIRKDRELASKLGYEINPKTGQGKRILPVTSVDIPNELYLIRHGKTIKRQDALDSEGYDQARQLAQRMEEMLKSRLERGEKVVLISSPRQRAKQTMQPFVDLVRDRYGVEIEIIENELADEMDLGGVPNLAPDQVSDVQKTTFGQIFKQHNVTARIEGAENFLNQIDRNRRLFKALKEEYPNVPIFIATHGIAIAAAIADQGDARAVGKDGWLQWTNVIPAETEIVRLDQAQLANLGGIDLNAQRMGLDIDKEGQGIEMKFDKAMTAEFQRGNFTGVEGTILRIIPVQSPLSLLGLNTASPKTPGNSPGLE